MSSKKRTNVRIILARARDALHLLGLRALVRLLPAPLAAKAALAAFMTTRRAPARATAEGGQRFTLADGTTGTWWGGGPPVYLVHGWNGHGGQLRAFVAPLAAAGYRVVAIDAPGHGDAAGDRSSVAHIAAALAAAVALHGPPHAVVAHSLGAAATVLAHRRGVPAPTRLVLVGPATAPSRYVRGFLDLVGASPAVRAAFDAQVVATLGVAPEAVDIAAGPLPDVPVLVVHDVDDREVPWRAAATLAAAWPGARLLTTRGLGHRRILAASEVVGAAAGFVAGRPVATPPIACGCGRLAAPGADTCERCALDVELFRPATRLVGAV